MKKKGSVGFTIAIIICLIVAAFSAYKLLTIYLSYKESADEYEALKEYAVVSTIDDAEEGEEQPVESTASEEPESETDNVIYQKAPVKVDFNALRTINSEIVGWLYIPALELSYPIVHHDDNDYYLHTTFEGTENSSGAIFMETVNTPDFEDCHTIVYGHNMKDGSMFGKLNTLLTEEKYKLNPTFWILTPERDYQYMIFSMQQTAPDSSVYTLFSDAGEEFQNYIESMKSMSLVTMDNLAHDENTHIVTLSTCAAGGEERFVVQGMRVE